MEWILMNADLLVTAVTSVVTAASAIANLTKTDADNKAIAYVSKFVNLLALNFRRS